MSSVVHMRILSTWNTYDLLKISTWFTVIEQQFWFNHTIVLIPADFCVHCLAQKVIQAYYIISYVCIYVCNTI